MTKIKTAAASFLGNARNWQTAALNLDSTKYALERFPGLECRRTRGNVPLQPDDLVRTEAKRPTDVHMAFKISTEFHPASLLP